MIFTDFIKELNLRLLEPLPGQEAHLPLSSLRRIREMFKNQDISKAKKSAVLILFYLDDNRDIMTILIQRPTYNGVHSGQIAFPGGKFEEYDADLIQTALRESREEVGIDPENVTVLGSLTELYIPPSQLTLLPVVGYQQGQPKIVTDPNEVAGVITISIKEILDPLSIQQKRVSVGSWSDMVPCFYIRGNVIWGATAMILNELKMILPAIPSLQ